MSKFAIFGRGDDPASSRMYDALELGTPQIMFSDLYLDQVAAFQCKVDWKRLVYQVPEQQFAKAPISTMSAVLEELLDGHTRWRDMWEATRQYKDDLVWSSENSRVGHNLLEEIGRRCTTGKRQVVWDAYKQRAGKGIE